MDRRTLLATAALPALYPFRGAAQPRKTEVTIRGDAFLINGRPTYAGRTFNGKRIEGLLMNIRAVQGIFDDLNPEPHQRSPISTSPSRAIICSRASRSTSRGVTTTRARTTIRTGSRARP